MAAFFSFTRNQSVVLFTLLFILVLGAVYFFLYIPANQTQLEEQRFRYLGKLEDNIHNKINNSVSLLNNQFSLKINGTITSKQTTSPSQGKIYANFILLPMETLDAKTREKLPDSTTSIDVKNGIISIHLTKGKFKVGMRYTPSQFIDSLLPRDVYDQFVILSNDSIIHQTFPIGVTEILKDSLQSVKSPFTDKHVKDITLGGKEFKVFSHSLKLIGQTKLTVLGLLTKQNFDNKKNKLPENLVLLLLLVAVATIFSLPWVKLYQMGNQDRLTVWDCLFSFGVSTMLMSLIFFGFFKYNVPFRPGEDESRVSQLHLANTIQDSLLSEVMRAYNSLNDLDKLKNKYGLGFNLIKFGTNKIESGDSSKRIDITNKVISTINSSKSGLDINQVFWLDEKGNEVVNWSASATNSPSGNFGGRDYFKKLKDKKAFQQGINEPEFYLEQVVSWTSGKFTSVLSREFKRQNDTLVGAVSINLLSVAKVVLPAGFTFSIIDKGGKVLYNSKTSKNLNEFMFDEFSEEQQLRAAVISGNPSFFYTDYMDGNYNVFVKPPKMMPYHIVILEDLTIKNVRDVKIFGFTFVMQMFFFLFLVIQFLAVYSISQKRTFFTKQFLDISWIGPNKNMSHLYIAAGFWNILNIFILLILLPYLSFPRYLFFLTSSALSVSLFLNYALSDFYNSSGNYHGEKHELKEKAIRVLWAIWFVLLGLATFVLRWDWFLVVIVIQILFIRFLFSSRFGFQQMNNIIATAKTSGKGSLIAEFFQKKDFSHSFSFMVFTRLIIVSGIPVLFFYMTSFNYETNLIGRHRQSKFISEIIGRTPVAPDSLYLAKHPDTLNLNGVYFDNIWINSYPNKLFAKPSNQSPVKSFTDSFLSTLTDYNISGTQELYRYSPENQFSYPDSNDCKIHTKYRSETINLELQSSPLPCKLPQFNLFTHDGRNGVVFWILFAGSLALFYYSLHRVLRKLFALDLPDQTGWKEIDDEILINNELNSLLFMIGVPGSGILEDVENKIKIGVITGFNGAVLTDSLGERDEEKVLTVDMTQIPDKVGATKDNEDWKKIQDLAASGSFPLVIIKNFEYDLKNPEVSHSKLNVIEKLISKGKSKIMIISAVHPVNFLESLNRQNVLKSNDSPSNDMERWHFVLGQFRIIVRKLNTQNGTIAGSQSWTGLLLRETASGNFLNQMQEPVIRALQQNINKSMIPEHLAFKMEINSHYFYMNVWQSLTKEEKFLLYDLAEDGMINPFDDYNISLLISKGLIIEKDGGLQLFNRAFRNFILTSIGTTEAMMIRTQIQDNGNWNQLKTPLIIMVIAVFAFVFVSQQDTYATVMKYMTILTASIPVALKFLDFFDKGNVKKD